MPSESAGAEHSRSATSPGMTITATPRLVSGTHGDSQHSRHLLRLRNQFAVMAAILEQMLRMRLLKVAASDLVLGICAAIASTGTRFRWQSKRPLMR
jgi:hypothetical protein